MATSSYRGSRRAKSLVYFSSEDNKFKLQSPQISNVSFAASAFPAVLLLVLVGYGLMARPLFFGEPAIPLEVVFTFAAAGAIAQLLWLGFSWDLIQQSIIARLSRALPAIFILFAIGLLVGAWMVSGTIPMLVDWGVRLIDPDWIYALAFVVPAIFSTLTGTSWGSAGTIGVVIMGVGASLGADIAIVAGAVIGGAYFGDKLSPLSDTTNMAAIAAEAPLFDHIRAMLWTTVPSACIALLAYTLIGLLMPLEGGPTDPEGIRAFLAGLESQFNYHPVLLLPPAVVLFGSLRRYPTLPVLLASILTATALGILLQSFALVDVLRSLTTGFSLSMGSGIAVPDAVRVLVERGGLYSMREAIFVALLVYLFIGAIDLLDTMPRVVGRIFAFAKGRAATVLAALGAAAATNAMTSNQSATAFIVGDAFGRRFDALGIPRPILSRSIEDTGTMIEPLIPWHATALFMVATLGVPVADYWHWQLLSLTNFIIAPLLAITGIGCFYGKGIKSTSASSPDATDESSPTRLEPHP
ncbi:MAG: NhaC family Na+:H+ antiporter [Candidatus Pseudothioglobus sp.]|jgi:NhaC family Na+:H+ antiporter